MNKRILVIGATGLLGKPVANLLQRSGYLVRFMVRNLEKATEIFGEDRKIVRGDINDDGSPERSLDDCFGVHINLSGEIERSG